MKDSVIGFIYSLEQTLLTLYVLDNWANNIFDSLIRPFGFKIFKLSDEWRDETSENESQQFSMIEGKISNSEVTMIPSHNGLPKQRCRLKKIHLLVFAVCAPSQLIWWPNGPIVFSTAAGRSNRSPQQQQQCSSMVITTIQPREQNQQSAIKSVATTTAAVQLNGHYHHSTAGTASAAASSTVRAAQQ